jgi:hypothetical protein
MPRPLPDTPPPAPAQTAPRKEWADGRPPGTHPATVTYRNVAALHNPLAQQGDFGNVAGLVAPPTRGGVPCPASGYNPRATCRRCRAKRRRPRSLPRSGFSGCEMKPRTRSFSMTYRIPGEMRCYESVSISSGVDPDVTWVGDGFSGNKQAFLPSVSHRNTVSDVLARLDGWSAATEGVGCSTPHMTPPA